MFSAARETGHPICGAVIASSSTGGPPHDPDIRLLLQGPKGGQPLTTSVGISILFTGNGRRFASAMRHLLGIVESGAFDRLVVLRDVSLPVHGTWVKGREYAVSFLRKGGGMVAIDREQRARLWACRSVLAEAASGDLFAGDCRIERLEAAAILSRSGILGGAPVAALLGLVPDGEAPRDPFGLLTSEASQSAGDSSAAIDPGRSDAVNRLVDLLRRHKIVSVRHACELLGTDDRPVSAAELNALLATCAHRVLLIDGKPPILRYRPDDDDTRERGPMA